MYLSCDKQADKNTQLFGSLVNLKFVHNTHVLCEEWLDVAERGQGIQSNGILLYCCCCSVS